ncbi:hypothetical protein VKT23_007257 [Stygiomarasmius scandens]|uniref:Non-specific serine/threonine protein kinase n=1 Tax=Marasmiellus scandens TaxID=2682957 RepID=A0ABR1JKH9_9AGAR
MSSATNSISALDLLKRGNDYRRNAQILKGKTDAATKTSSIPEMMLEDHLKVRQVVCDNTFLEAAVAEWHEYLEDTQCDTETQMGFLFLLKCAFKDKLGEKNESTTHQIHAYELDALHLICNLVFQQKYKRMDRKLERYSEASEDDNVTPDHCSRINLEEYQDQAWEENEPLQYMITSTSHEDKTMRVGAGVFRPKDGKIVETTWPGDPEPTTETSRITAQLTTQLVNSNTPYGVYYTLNRVLYIYHDRSQQRLFRSWHPSKDSADQEVDVAPVVDYVEYVSWILQGYALKYENEKESIALIKAKADREKEKRQRHRALRSNFVFTQFLRLFNGVTITVGSLYRKTFLDTSSLPPSRFSKHLPPFQLHFPEHSAVWSHNHKKLVAISPTAVAKISASDSRTFEHECKMTLKAAHLLPGHTPKVLMISRGDLNLLLQTYEGPSLDEWSDLSRSELVLLLQLIQQAHDGGLHHHDIAPRNITLSGEKSVSIID